MSVAVTTTADRFERWAGPLRSHGLRPVALPCISVAPAEVGVIGQMRDAARDADRIVLTSPRTVAVVWPDGLMPATPVLAVGRATAEAVHRAGGVVSAVGDGGAAGLLRDFGSDLVGHVVAYPHAAGADGAILNQIQKISARVLAASVYATQPIPPSHEPAVEAVIFASPSAVDGWVLSRPLGGPVVAAIGATTASYVRSLHARPEVVASEPNPEALARALVAHLTERNVV